MTTTERVQGLSRLVTVALVLAVAATITTSVQTLSARGADCIDYRCSNDEECQSVEDCDTCHTDSRCAISPE